MSTSLFGLSLLQENTKLLLVQTLFRHGDRSPLAIYPGDPNNASCCPEGLGKLSLLGRKQQYAVGKYLRSRYKDFITSNPNEILVNSSDSDRCLRSVEANIASFYAPIGIWKIEKDLDWQPIPVHYIPYAEDKFLSFPVCPRASDEALNLFESDDVQSFFRSNQKSFDELSQLAGFNVSKGLNPMAFYDTLKAEKIHNLTIPSWVQPYWNILEKSSDLISHCFFSSPQLVKLRSGPLLQVITDNMKGKMNGSLPDLKLQIFSSHDDNLGAMLYALTSAYYPRPPYSSTIVFELHQLQNQKGAVRVLYLNSTTPEIDIGKPHVLTLKGCSEFCPLDKFAKITRPLIPRDYDAECQQQDKGTKSNVDDSQKTLLKQHFKKYYH
ncbi:Testicular acid phosphatase [Araneus ventricosus]|uniref:acid phosphatase n=1 Tax=Araneus ventricosus TaxID=182803 RepID=A0A4Y2NDY3_ARAVE|nr:Testicular acid phosphatase [Araneus ventricosus]